MKKTTRKSSDEEERGGSEGCPFLSFIDYFCPFCFENIFWGGLQGQGKRIAVIKRLHDYNHHPSASSSSRCVPTRLSCRSDGVRDCLIPHAAATCSTPFSTPVTSRALRYSRPKAHLQVHASRAWQTLNGIEWCNEGQGCAWVQGGWNLGGRNLQTEQGANCQIIPHSSSLWWSARGPWMERDPSFAVSLANQSSVQPP